MGGLCCFPCLLVIHLWKHLLYNIITTSGLRNNLRHRFPFNFRLVFLISQFNLPPREVVRLQPLISFADGLCKRQIAWSESLQTAPSEIPFWPQLQSPLTQNDGPQIPSFFTDDLSTLEVLPFLYFYLEDKHEVIFFLPNPLVVFFLKKS